MHRSTTSATAPSTPPCTALAQQHAVSFIAHTEASTGCELPQFIKDPSSTLSLSAASRRTGFLRLRCAECGHDKLLAFRYQRRGFCPTWILLAGQ
jgi:hypothetical protein